MSGAKGAGKTTQASHLADALRRQGVRARSVTLCRLNVATWIHHVSRRMTRRRGGRDVSLTFERFATIAGEEPSQARASLSSALSRNLLYLCDVLVFRVYHLWAALRGDEVLVLDRWFIDVQSRLRHRGIKLWRLSLWITPRPCVSFLLMADDRDRTMRRHWIDPRSLRAERAAYDRSNGLHVNLMVIAAADRDEVSARIEAHVRPRLADLTNESCEMMAARRRIRPHELR